MEAVEDDALALLHSLRRKTAALDANYEAAKKKEQNESYSAPEKEEQTLPSSNVEKEDLQKQLRALRVDLRRKVCRGRKRDFDPVP